MARAICGALVVATVGSQHPGKLFKRLQHKNLFGIVPNWAFFATTPGTHDFHVIVRHVLNNDSVLGWHDIEFIEERRLHHAIWFPSARQKKALYDLVGEILSFQERGVESMASSPAFRVLASHLQCRLPGAYRDDMTGFRFAVVESTGYDDGEDPRVKLVSPPLPVASRL